MASGRRSLTGIHGSSRWAALPLLLLGCGAAPLPAPESPCADPGMVRTIRIPEGEATWCEHGGRRHGPTRFRDAAGRVRIEGYYAEDRRHGRWTWFYESGERALEAAYTAGRLHGTVRAWHRNGRQSAEVEFESGAPRGRYRAWSLTGALEADLTLDGRMNDELRAVWSRQNDAGTIASPCTVDRVRSILDRVSPPLLACMDADRDPKDEPRSIKWWLGDDGPPTKVELRGLGAEAERCARAVLDRLGPLAADEKPCGGIWLHLADRHAWCQARRPRPGGIAILPGRCPPAGSKLGPRWMANTSFCDEELVRLARHAATARARRCYPPGALAAAPRSARFIATARVGPAGNIIRVTLDRDELGIVDARACVLQAVQEILLPPPRGGLCDLHLPVVHGDSPPTEPPTPSTP